MTATKKCRKCGGPAVPIVYGGPPDRETWERERRGEIVLGGCILDPRNPSWACRACNHRWGSPLRLARARRAIAHTAIVESLRALEDAHRSAVEAGDVEHATSLARTIGDTRAALESSAGPTHAARSKMSKADKHARQVADLLTAGTLRKAIPDVVKRPSRTVDRDIARARKLGLLT